MTEKSAIREALERLDEIDPELALRLRKEIGLSELKPLPGIPRRGRVAETAGEGAVNRRAPRTGLM